MHFHVISYRIDVGVRRCSYITMAFPMGNLAALRTFRVLRALKTVAVVPGKRPRSSELSSVIQRYSPQYYCPTVDGVVVWPE